MFAAHPWEGTQLPKPTHRLSKPHPHPLIPATRRNLNLKYIVPGVDEDWLQEKGPDDAVEGTYGWLRLQKADEPDGVFFFPKPVKHSSEKVSQSEK